MIQNYEQYKSSLDTLVLLIFIAALNERQEYDICSMNDAEKINSGYTVRKIMAMVCIYAGTKMPESKDVVRSMKRVTLQYLRKQVEIGMYKSVLVKDPNLNININVFFPEIKFIEKIAKVQNL